MEVVPLADVDVNVPGVIATLVAPVAAQLSMLLAPEFTLVGFAAKEVIVGSEPFTVDEFDAAPQLTRPMQKSRIPANAQT